ncbi:MAG: hypothetical protein ACLFRT_14520 [Actinomycetota bacterium]
MPRRFADDFEEAFPTLLDAENILGQMFGFKAVPNGLLVSPQGRIDAIVAGKFDIRQPESKQLIETWLAGNEIPVLEPPAALSWSSQALRLFREAAAAIRRNDREEAIRLLKLAYPLEPDNYIIRKQLWTIEHPDRFYAGDIDTEWQRCQLEQGL